MMIQDDFIRAVSRATGDDYSVINSRGFSLVSDEAPLCDADLEALILDWTNIENERAKIDIHKPHSNRSYGRVPTSGALKRHKTRYAVMTGLGRPVDAAH